MTNKVFQQNLDDKKGLRNEIASRLDIDSFQELLASHWKPYLAVKNERT